MNAYTNFELNPLTFNRVIAFERNGKQTDKQTNKNRDDGNGGICPKSTKKQKQKTKNNNKINLSLLQNI
ncbi:MAG TPA: hypothetical protein VEM27_07645, partial [Gemmatimonadales bacterium]|nr:hypothetical protein [Gemmatimonadales bacterium]